MAVPGNDESMRDLARSFNRNVRGVVRTPVGRQDLQMMRETLRNQGTPGLMGRVNGSELRYPMSGIGQDVYDRQEMMRRAAEQKMARDMLENQEMVRKVSQMRMINNDGLAQDPLFASYRANTIRRRIYDRQKMNFIRGNISAHDMANTEDYLNSVSDDEVVKSYPMFFDMNSDIDGFYDMMRRKEGYPVYDYPEYGSEENVPYGYDEYQRA